MWSEPFSFIGSVLAKMSAQHVPPLTVLPLLGSSSFYLAAGTVTLDRLHRKVLIIYDRRDQSHKLPRGHKDWGESLEAAALRETFEETGYHAALLPIPLPTRATAPRGAAKDPFHPLHPAASAARYHCSGDLMLGGSARLAEPFALMQHYQPDGSLAVVLWFVAEADSLAKPAEGTQGLDEDYEALWVDYAVAPGLMVNDPNVQLVRQALDLAEQLEVVEKS
ncbi:hypothetical protein QBC47DRAFT_386198 [Echria macrotheca]|uniref:Nudix hydrolase domain-containing protein n=1 Tax=Echria macrotheca TaxID=438768 RepID=A0AAJ0F3E1_9PEZI|nr:hypothetical protein QBC47DRAFT_386198 [Echria macrotheca]